MLPLIGDCIDLKLRKGESHKSLTKNWLINRFGFQIITEDG